MPGREAASTIAAAIRHSAVPQLDQSITDPDFLKGPSGSFGISVREKLNELVDVEIRARFEELLSRSFSRILVDQSPTFADIWDHRVEGCSPPRHEPGRKFQ